MSRAEPRKFPYDEYVAKARACIVRLRETQEPDGPRLKAQKAALMQQKAALMQAFNRELESLLEQGHTILQVVDAINKGEMASANALLQAYPPRRPRNAIYSVSDV